MPLACKCVPGEAPRLPTVILSLVACFTHHVAMALHAFLICDARGSATLLLGRGCPACRTEIQPASYTTPSHRSASPPCSLQSLTQHIATHSHNLYTRITLTLARLQGGGERFNYPKYVWAPSGKIPTTFFLSPASHSSSKGGWWPDPPHWRRNTALAIGLMFLLCVPIFRYSAAREVCV